MFIRCFSLSIRDTRLHLRCEIQVCGDLYAHDNHLHTTVLTVGTRLSPPIARCRTPQTTKSVEIRTLESTYTHLVHIPAFCATMHTIVQRMVPRIVYMWSRWQEAQRDPCPGMHPAESSSIGPTSTAATIAHVFSFFCAYIPHGIPAKTHCYRTPRSHTHVLWYRWKISTSYHGCISWAVSRHMLDSSDR